MHGRSRNILPLCLRAESASQETDARITFGERLQRFTGMQPRRHASSPGCLRALHRAASVGPAAPSLQLVLLAGAKV